MLKFNEIRFLELKVLVEAYAEERDSSNICTQTLLDYLYPNVITTQEMNKLHQDEPDEAVVKMILDKISSEELLLLASVLVDLNIRARDGKCLYFKVISPIASYCLDVILPIEEADRDNGMTYFADYKKERKECIKKLVHAKQVQKIYDEVESKSFTSAGQVLDTMNEKQHKEHKYVVANLVKDPALLKNIRVPSPNAYIHERLDNNIRVIKELNEK